MFVNLQQEQLAMITHKERLARAEQAYRYIYAPMAQTPRGANWLQRLLRQARRQVAAQPAMTVDPIGTASRQQTA